MTQNLLFSIYEAKDFQYINQFLQALGTSVITITPQVLTEMFYMVHKELGNEFENFVKSNLRILLNALKEDYVNKDWIINEDDKFPRFFFTDVSIIISSKKNEITAMITDDFPLSQYCLSLKDKIRLIINFSHDIKPYFLTIRNSP